jgi:A/G-specific adenine glycosylase
MQSPKANSNLVEIVNTRGAQLRSCLQVWAATYFRQFPWRETPNPYSVLIAETLLRRTTASAVSKLFTSFISQYPNIQRLAEADRSKLEELLLKIGYNKQRARILIEIAQFVVSHYDGQIPADKKLLLKIPHVGDYTANAIMSLGCGIPSAMVDSNVSRILQRLFKGHFCEKVSLETIQMVADMLAPQEGNQKYNLTLLDFGALVCTYGVPRCSICPLREICDYSLEGNSSR